MGKIVAFLRLWIQSWAKYNPLALSAGGVLITLIVVFISGLFGWLIEQLTLPHSPIPQWLGITILIIGLTSGLAAGSLRLSIKKVLKVIPEGKGKHELISARKELNQIVGRDVSE